MDVKHSILIVEDSETKFDDVRSLVTGALGQLAEITRTTNLNEAEDKVMEGGWDLLLLDLSMDIAASGSADLGTGHATLAGLDVVERLSLMKIELALILVTAFDSFQDPDRFDNAIMNLDDIDAIVSQMLGDNYLGCIRYGSEQWDEKLRLKIAKWVEKRENSSGA